MPYPGLKPGVNGRVPLRLRGPLRPIDRWVPQVSEADLLTVGVRWLPLLTVGDRKRPVRTVRRQRGEGLDR